MGIGIITLSWATTKMGISSAWRVIHLFKPISQWTDKEVYDINMFFAWTGLIASALGITSTVISMLISLKRNDPKLLKQLEGGT